MAKSLLSLATLACEEQNHAQALILLDKAQALGGDEEFWYQLTLTKVRVIVSQKDQDAQTKVKNNLLPSFFSDYLVILVLRLNSCHCCFPFTD